jgi:hypothetical protein
MTRAELEARWRQYNRHWLWVAVVIFSVLICAILFGIPTVLGLPARILSNPPENERPLRVVWSLCNAGVGVIAMVFVVCYRPVTARRFGLICPSCASSLTRERRDSLLSTRTCSRCGAKVIDDWPA